MTHPANVEAIVFKNRDGLNLFGTLHTPSNSSANRPVIVLLSSGVKMRVGPHRLYNRIADKFTDLGFIVFKFDFVGLGDSEGELDRELMGEVYNDTETGAFVNDGVDALDWLESRLGTKSFILGGLCGGAITSILLAKDDLRVQGLISLGMTVTLAMGGVDRVQFASQNELAALRRGYFARMLDPKSWLRLFTFQSDFRTIYRSINQLFQGKKNTAPNNQHSEHEKPPSNANPLFPPAFFEMAGRGKKILLVFSESDRLFWDFDEKFAQPYAAELANLEGSYELHVIKDANHVFSFREWEEDMLRVTSEWLKAGYPLPDQTLKP